MAAQLARPPSSVLKEGSQGTRGKEALIDKYNGCKAVTKF